MLRFIATGMTHVGLVRACNQDAAVITDELVLVADGVGGGAAGEVASATAAHAVLDVVGSSDQVPVMALAEAVRCAQERVAHGVSDDPGREGMATTLTALVARGGEVAIVHLGDSRAYVHREDELLQLTRDHTWTARAVHRGTISETEAESHPWRNVILRSVNGSHGQTGDLLPLALRPGDRVLVASDGLTDLVAPEWIEQLFGHHEDDDGLAAALVAAALGEGGRDNVTVVVATVVDTPAPPAGEPVLLGAAAEEHHVVRCSDVRHARATPAGAPSVPESPS